MRYTLLVFLSLTAWPAAAETCYRVDAEAGEVRFEIEQDDVPFTGSFERYGGEVCLAENEVRRVDVWLEPGSVETGLPEVDDALRGPLFFETDRYPRITFTSSDVRRRPPEGAWTARGTVTVKGEEHALEVPFGIEEDGPGYRVIGETTLDRLRYDVGTGEWSDTRWLGGEVALRFSVPLSPAP